MRILAAILVAVVGGLIALRFDGPLAIYCIGGFFGSLTSLIARRTAQ